MPLPKSGRQIIMERLNKAIHLATTADLLEGAREVRLGSRRQRTTARSSQATAWKKKVDNSITW